MKHTVFASVLLLAAVEAGTNKTTAPTGIGRPPTPFPTEPPPAPTPTPVRRLKVLTLDYRVEIG